MTKFFGIPLLMEFAFCLNQDLKLFGSIPSFQTMLFAPAGNGML